MSVFIVDICVQILCPQINTYISAFLARNSARLSIDSRNKARNKYIEHSDKVYTETLCSPWKGACYCHRIKISASLLQNFLNTFLLDLLFLLLHSCHARFIQTYNYGLSIQKLLVEWMRMMCRMVDDKDTTRTNNDNKINSNNNNQWNDKSGIGKQIV